MIGFTILAMHTLFIHVIGTRIHTHTLSLTHTHTHTHTLTHLICCAIIHLWTQTNTLIAVLLG